MKLHLKLPPAPSLPHGLIALVRVPHPSHASMRAAAELRSAAEPVEETRAWRPDRSLLQSDALATGSSDFALAADEKTMVGRTNLNDPILFRSEPPPALVRDPALEDVEEEHTTVEFVGSLMDPDRDEARPMTASADDDEKTRFYRPLRDHLVPEEFSDELDAAAESQQATLLGPVPPKVILAAAILADSAPDPARAEATKKKRRWRQSTDMKLGLGLCLLGGLALALSAAARHPRTAPMTHDAFARVAAVGASLLNQ